MRGNTRHFAYDAAQMPGIRQFSSQQEQFNQRSFTTLLHDSEEDYVLETQEQEAFCHSNSIPLGQSIPAPPVGHNSTNARTTMPPDATAARNQNPNPRQYVSTHWNAHDLMILQAAKKDDDEKRLFGGNREKHNKKDARWQEIEEFCWKNGVRRSAKACLTKWEGLAQDFKKINDYQREIPSGRSSYWQMSSAERKDFNLPVNFFSDVYDAMDRWYGKKTAVNPGGLVFESSIPASFSTPIPPTGNDADLTQEEEDGIESPDTPAADAFDSSAGASDGNVIQPEHSSGKKRARIPRGVDGWISLMQKSEEARSEWRSRQEDMQTDIHAEQVALKKQSLDIAATAANALQVMATGFLQLCQNSNAPK